ncbi:hypothetical protein IU500_13550 [Nocardia terpenica]|uniref:hypothetical protein n=1 Tax=Nocardia terpenica TaxID=455432 RepID=UPI001894A84F|nr:hypothetical protein [Nocardia terpenica]MBF6062797.1 hypothetical protein [Nocardia terpenica]MBF6105068.1 hypothetical protein [Nocardia terpenica]MBF6112495.1 hypothetical protein [Nocardia terpenica]MBF6118796.1 hypothetical protein [Nocardia terpenica]MBF6154265.1 hypothetical protein [Nocardia terpenica]
MHFNQRAQREELHISDYPGAYMPVLPEPADEDFVWARANPGKWQYFTDPRADKSALQQANVIGGWLADDKGGFAERWLNPEFVPTPQYARRDLASEFELVIWRLEYGFNNIGRFVDALSRSELHLVLPEDDPQGQRGWPLLYRGEDTVLEVYTSVGRLPKDVNPWLRRTVSGMDVLEQVCPLAGSWVLFNPGSGHSYIEMPGSQLAAWWREWCEAERTGAAAESDQGD